MQLSTLAKRGSLVLFLAVVAFYFYGLGHLPLLGPDEPRYAQIAREMFLRGDLITPTLGGRPWFEKPALLYWMIIGSYKLFGVAEWSARLPAAISGLLTVVAVFCIGRRVELSSADDDLRSLGSCSALATASSIGIAVFSRAASFDIVLTMATTWSLAFFILSEFQEDPKQRRRFLAGFYTLVGISLLAKGLVGLVIPLGVVGAYCALHRTFRVRNILFSLVWGIPLALAVAATWYAPVVWRHGWLFIDQFFLQHHFARYITNKYNHPQPVYYYLMVFPMLFLPWTIFLLGELGRLRYWHRIAPGKNDGVGKTMTASLNRFRVLAILWLLLPLVFFSFSTSKLPGYILPALPAGALLVGERLAALARQPKRSDWRIKVTAALCLVFAIAAPIYVSRSGELTVVCALLMSLPLVVAGIFAMVSSRTTTSTRLLAAATLVNLVIALHCAAPYYAGRQSTRGLIELANAKGYSQAPIFGMQRDDRTPEFYAAGRVVYGSDGEPIMFQGLGPVISESRKRREALLIFVRLRDLPYLTAIDSAQTDILGDNGRVAIIAVMAK